MVEHPLARKRIQIGLIAAASLLANAVWFSASAVVPQLTVRWGLDDAARSWLTISVQLGFVAGALLSALTNLADRVSLPRLFAISSLVAAASTAAIPVFARGTAVALPLRFLTGMALAGVYPPGMKLIATWALKDRGLGIGILVGALTLGSAMPHLLNAIVAFAESGMPDWRAVLFQAAALALVASAIAALFIRPGPHLGKSAPFDWRFAGRAFAHRPTRLANFGYLGHMWELYAMWTWAPVFLLASFEAAGKDPALGRLAGFGAVAAGLPGSVLAGLLADRLGRTRIATASLLISGACSLTVGLFFGLPMLLAALCLVWGFAAVADSAQFSAAVSELTDPRYVGTALTLQTLLGFLLTTATIRLVPTLVAHLGWPEVFPVLAIGPAFGVWSMLALRRHPEAVKMASGAR